MSDQSTFQLTVLGARGSIPISGRNFMQFGGNTSCYMVRAGEQTIFLDAGSGLLSAPISFSRPPAILLSHLHLDHLLGLGSYRRLLQEGAETDLYLPADSEDHLLEMLDGLYSPPYWPLSLTEYRGTLRLHPYTQGLQIGEVSVETAEGHHPGKSRLIRLQFRGKSLVYATDFEHGEEASRGLIKFAAEADLLLYDGQFTEEDYVNRIGFGHSTAKTGHEIMERCGARQMLIIHHDPSATDETLLRQEERIKTETVRFAREGETVSI